jgi:magnesium-transporting ATPase (P-type)
MGRGEEYECPDCGALFGFGQQDCPSCGVGIDWDDAEGVEIGEEPLKLMDPRLPHREEAIVSQEPVFSRWGLVLSLLTAVAFLGTMMMMRWDTWVRGEAMDSVGDDQRMLIYAGAVATTLFAILAILDIMRGHATAVGLPGDNG